MTVQPVIDIRRISPLLHDEAMHLARTEYERLATLLDSLTEDDWTHPTCCSPWTVRDMATHLLGYMRACSSAREMVRQMRAARSRGGVFIDAMSAHQVSTMADLPVGQLRAEIRSLIEPAVRGRATVPAVFRRMVKVPAELPVFGVRERWPLGFVVDTIGIRDGWMHRTDICAAIGREPELTPEHDGRIVSDVVAEWARRLGRPVDLRLTGPAGRAYADGAAEFSLRYDAVQFCRLLSGRDGTPPLGTEVPF